MTTLLGAAARFRPGVSSSAFTRIHSSASAPVIVAHKRWVQRPWACRLRQRLVSTSAAAEARFETETVGDGFGGKYILPNGMVDLYVVLGVDDDAAPSEIKKAYRALARECHPDFLGDAGHDICILLNEAYEVLSDADKRREYDIKLEQALVDYDDDFTGRTLSKWTPTVAPHMAKNTDPDERRGVFVDELSCIGCKQCVWCASAMFRIEPEHGRSRVYAQWLDTEDKIQASIDACPVNCIHWVDKEDLPALEYVMQKRLQERVNVGIMLSGSASTQNVFDVTMSFLKERRRREEMLARESERRAYSPAQEKARRSAAEKLRSKKTGWAFQSFGFSDLLQDMFGNMSVHVEAPEEADLRKVGKRKRSVRWDELAQMQRDSGSNIPIDRSLVPLSVYSKDQI